MHPRNRYAKSPPDLASLAQKYPPLAAFLHRNDDNDEKDKIFYPDEPGATEALVTAMLRVDFDVQSYSGVPSGFLVPSVTRSLNYLHFVEDLVAEARRKELGLSSVTRGLDIGVGASCVFPLLGCVLHDDWRFVGVDIDDEAIASAKANAALFDTRVEIRKGAFFSALKDDETFDFALCNPPFFSTSLEEGETPGPFGGRPVERSCEGGEVRFVNTLVAQSAMLKYNIVWFSSMLGVKESLRPVLGELHHLAERVCAIRVYRLEQGKTFRWVVAWSFRKELAKGIFGEQLSVDNLARGTMESRAHEALSGLRHFTPETGVCGGENFRFRVRVDVCSDTNTFSVDILDLHGSEAERQARSVKQRVEQDILRKSRKWRKRGRE